MESIEQSYLFGLQPKGAAQPPFAQIPPASLSRLLRDVEQVTELLCRLHTAEMRDHFGTQEARGEVVGLNIQEILYDTPGQRWVLLRDVPKKDMSQLVSKRPAATRGAAAVIIEYSVSPVKQLGESIFPVTVEDLCTRPAGRVYIVAVLKY